MKKTGAIPKKLKNVTDNKGDGYSRTISNEAACKGVSHFFDMGHTEIKCQHIDDRFTASRHGAGCSAGKRIGTCDFQNILQDYKRAAA